MYILERKFTAYSLILIIVRFVSKITPPIVINQKLNFTKLSELKISL